MFTIYIHFSCSTISSPHTNLSARLDCGAHWQLQYLPFLPLWGFSLLLCLHPPMYFYFYFSLRSIFPLRTINLLPFTLRRSLATAIPVLFPFGFSHYCFASILPCIFNSTPLYFPSSYRPVCPSRLWHSLATAIPVLSLPSGFLTTTPHPCLSHIFILLRTISTPHTDLSALFLDCGTCWQLRCLSFSPSGFLTTIFTYMSTPYFQFTALYFFSRTTNLHARINCGTRWQLRCLSFFPFGVFFPFPPRFNRKKNFSFSFFFFLFSFFSFFF